MALEVPHCQLPQDRMRESPHRAARSGTGWLSEGPSRSPPSSSTCSETLRLSTATHASSCGSNNNVLLKPICTKIFLCQVSQETTLLGKIAATGAQAHRPSLNTWPGFQGDAEQPTAWQWLSILPHVRGTVSPSGRAAYAHFNPSWVKYL